MLEVVLARVVRGGAAADPEMVVIEGWGFVGCSLAWWRMILRW